LFSCRIRQYFCLCHVLFLPQIISLYRMGSLFIWMYE
jgi:hypothetical protein